MTFFCDSLITPIHYYGAALKTHHSRLPRTSARAQPLLYPDLRNCSEPPKWQDLTDTVESTLRLGVHIVEIMTLMIVHAFAHVLTLRRLRPDTFCSTAYAKLSGQAHIRLSQSARVIFSLPTLTKSIQTHTSNNTEKLAKRLRQKRW